MDSSTIYYIERMNIGSIVYNMQIVRIYASVHFNILKYFPELEVNPYLFFFFFCGKEHHDEYKSISHYRWRGM